MKNSQVLAPLGRGGGGGIISDSPSVTARPAKRRKIRAIRLPNGILKALNSGLSVSGTISGLIFRTRSGKTHLYAIKSSAIRNAHAKAVITVVMFTLSALIMPTSAIITHHATPAVHRSTSRNASGSSINITQRQRFIDQHHTTPEVSQSTSRNASGSSNSFANGSKSSRCQRSHPLALARDHASITWIRNDPAEIISKGDNNIWLKSFIHPSSQE